MANPNQEVKYTKLFINNEFVDAASGRTFPTINPSTEKKIAEIAEGDKADVDLAVKAAKKAFERGSVWRSLDTTGRTQLMNKLADLITREASVLGNLEALDTGKPIEQAIMQVHWSAMMLRSTASYADKIYGRTIPSDGGFFRYTRKEAIGVVGQIIPFNFPIVMLISKIAPALAAGCTIVLKPAEQTPLTAIHVAALSKEAGFPAGVLNIIPGYGPTAGAAISSHQDIRKVGFTGSTLAGRSIMEAAAKSNLKKVSLELGGKSPFVVFDDANLDEAVPAACEGIYLNAGQVCVAPTRMFVQESIHDEFLKKAVSYAKARKLGTQYEKGAQMGPQIDKDSFDKVLQYIDFGNKDGATLETGGKRWGNEGYFVEPTIFSNVTDKMRIATDEIFGPVMSVLKFKTLEEVIERANNTEYGLAAYVFTKNIDQALAFANQVEAGSVKVNAFGAGSAGLPFGGYKQSGMGREGADYGVELYMETKAVSIKMPYKM